MGASARKEQKIVLYQSSPKGIFSGERVDNLGEINGLLADGWRVVSMSPTSSPSISAGAEARLYALVVLERG